MSQYGTYFTNNGPGGFVQTLTSNIGGPVPPTAGNINVIGGNNITGTGNPGTSTITFNLTGTTNHAVQVGNATGSLTSIGLGAAGQVLTSNGAGADPSFQALPASSITINGDTGSATGGTLNLQGNTLNTSTTLTFQAGGTDIAVHFADADNNIVISEDAQNQPFVATNGNNLFGYGALVGAFPGIFSGQFNNFFGYNPAFSLDSGSYNAGFGSQPLLFITSGSYNLCLAAYQGGVNYNLGFESHNISINASTTTVAGESNTLRIGDGTGAGTMQLNRAFISGINGVNVGSTAKVVTMFGVSDQLGTATITAGTGITVTPAANTITIAQTSTPIINNYTTVNASPYVVTATDYYMSVDTSTIPITIQLPNAPTQYRTFIIKDSAGNALAQNITVTTVGGVVLIEGATTFVMNTNYASINLLYDGVGYQIY